MLVMQEYGFVQGAIDKIDTQRFQIRYWAIVGAGALFTVSLSARIPLVGFAGAVTTIFFFFLEIIYIQMVSGVIVRCSELDAFINSFTSSGMVPEGYVFGVGQAFRGNFSFSQIPKTIFVRDRIHVTAFYIGLLAVTITGGLIALLR